MIRQRRHPPRAALQHHARAPRIRRPRPRDRPGRRSSPIAASSTATSTTPPAACARTSIRRATRATTPTTAPVASSASTPRRRHRPAILRRHGPDHRAPRRHRRPRPWTYDRIGRCSPSARWTPPASSPARSATPTTRPGPRRPVQPRQAHGRRGRRRPHRRSTTTPAAASSAWPASSPPTPAPSPSSQSTEYDAQDRILREVFPDGTELRREYTARGLEAPLAGWLTAATYDPRGRWTAHELASGVRNARVLDHTGRLQPTASTAARRPPPQHAHLRRRRPARRHRGPPRPGPVAAASSTTISTASRAPRAPTASRPGPTPTTTT
jgi:YD repeat-containing protein